MSGDRANWRVQARRPLEVGMSLRRSTRSVLSTCATKGLSSQRSSAASDGSWGTGLRAPRFGPLDGRPCEDGSIVIERRGGYPP